MSKLFIDDKAIEFIKKTLENERSDAVRLFTGGGGCCKRFELTSVKNPLARDVTFIQGGITVHVEKELAENTSTIKIRFEAQKGLVIEFENDQGKCLNKINS